MHNHQTDIGYCISTVLKDYAVTIDPDICLLLCSPLWLGLNVSKKQAYIPLEGNCIAYLNPLFLENFAVNTNCLFIPGRGNSLANFEYLKYRFGNGKKTLVKIDGRLLNNDNPDTVQTSVLAVVDSITSDGTETDAGMVSLIFSAENQLIIPAGDFIKHWYSETQQRVNTDLFRMIPSKNRASEVLMAEKIKSALEKQQLNLRSNEQSLLTGNAVLEYLKYSIANNSNDYGTLIRHKELWHNKAGIVDLKRKYANALDKLAFMDEPVHHMKIKNSLLNSANHWTAFFEILDTHSLTVAQLLSHYQTLIESENEVINSFNLSA